MEIFLFYFIKKILSEEIMQKNKSKTLNKEKIRNRKKWKG